MIVEGHVWGFCARTWGGMKEEPSEEYKQEGAHLGIYVSRMKIQDRLYTYHFDSVQMISELGKSKEIDIWSVG